MMKEEAAITLLNTNDIEAAVNLVRQSFKESDLINSIYRAEGIKRFISFELENPLAASSYNLLVNNGMISGFSEFKGYDNIVFLNMIAISPSAQGKGYAKKMLLNGISKYKNEGSYETMKLDVSTSNMSALNLYSSLGFIHESTRYLYKSNSSASSLAKKIVITNYPQVQALRCDFGFAMMEFKIEGEHYKTGIIGNDLLLYDCKSDIQINHLKEINSIFNMDNIYILTRRSKLPDSIQLASIQRLKLDLD